MLKQEVIDIGPHGRARRATDECEEVLFVVAGAGELRRGGERHPLAPETGANLGPGDEYEVENFGSEPMRLVSVRVPDPDPAPEPDPARVDISERDLPERATVRRLTDQDAQDATSERSYRIVADPTTGLRSATHFVGYIPTGRAPEHFHTYDEVIYVLDGEGAFHANGEHTTVRSGSTIELPARTVHCLENTGQGVMRVVAAFRPAGSPAAAYFPDGSPAYPGTPLLTTPIRSKGPTRGGGSKHQ